MIGLIVVWLHIIISSDMGAYFNFVGSQSIDTTMIFFTFYFTFVSQIFFTERNNKKGVHYAPNTTDTSYQMIDLLMKS